MIFETLPFPLTWDWFNDMPLRASKRNENKLRVWKMRRIYLSHSRSCLVSCCLDENVNQALNTGIGAHTCGLSVNIYKKKMVRYLSPKAAHNCIKSISHNASGNFWISLLKNLLLVTYALCACHHRYSMWLSAYKKKIDTVKRGLEPTPQRRETEV